MRTPISFVIPIYGVERYLTRCVDSVLSQAEKDFEAILVDDGSPDGSGLIADEYAALDDRVIAIHQSNRWLGGARNTGFKLSAGDYVAFVDSDDYVSPEYSETVLSFLEKSPVDMLFFNIRHVDEAGHVVCNGRHPFEPGRVYSSSAIHDTLYPVVISSHSINSACMKVYRRAVLLDNGIFFDETIRYAEDYEFCLRLFPVLNSFSYVDVALYYYVENPASIMHSADPAIIDRILVLYEAREAFLREQGIDTEKNERRSAELLTHAIVNALPRYLGTEKYSEAVELIRRICEEDRVVDAALISNGEEMGFGAYGRMMLFAIKHGYPRLACILFRLNKLTMRNYHAWHS